MKQEELARTFARKTHQSKSAARDQLDQVVHAILTQLRKGRPVELPGIGKLTLAGLINLEEQRNELTK
jgi:nucleoid DNA-binding protein